MKMIVPNGIASGGHYSPAVQAGDFIFVAGQTPRNADRQVVGVTIEEQTAAALRNLESILKAAGAGLDDVVKTTVHLLDLTEAQRFNAVYASFFPRMRPARTTVGSQLNGVRVEIDAIAYVGRNNEGANIVQ
jgi:2-iminobutanoate/2-iminopropanoate deaminase